MNKEISRGSPDFKKIPISFVAIHLKLTFCEASEATGKVSRLIQVTVMQFLHCEQTQHNIDIFSIVHQLSPSSEPDADCSAWRHKVATAQEY
jgi:hypothetical protein